MWQLLVLSQFCYFIIWKKTKFEFIIFWKLEESDDEVFINVQNEFTPFVIKKPSPTPNDFPCLEEFDFGACADFSYEDHVQVLSFPRLERLKLCGCPSHTTKAVARHIAAFADLSPRLSRISIPALELFPNELGVFFSELNLISLDHELEIVVSRVCDRPRLNNWLNCDSYLKCLTWIADNRGIPAKFSAPSPECSCPEAVVSKKKTSKTRTSNTKAKASKTRATKSQAKASKPKAKVSQSRATKTRANSSTSKDKASLTNAVASKPRAKAKASKASE